MGPGVRQSLRENPGTLASSSQALFPQPWREGCQRQPPSWHKPLCHHTSHFPSRVTSISKMAFSLLPFGPATGFYMDFLVLPSISGKHKSVSLSSDCWYYTHFQGKVLNTLCPGSLISLSLPFRFWERAQRGNAFAISLLQC